MTGARHTAAILLLAALAGLGGVVAGSFVDHRGPPPAALALLERLGAGRLAQAWSDASAPAVPAGVPVARVGEPRPDPALLDLDGRPRRLGEWQGRRLLVNFWATWCGPCLLEMPLIQKYQDRYPDKFRVLAVNDDEASADVQAYIAKLGLSFTVLLDPGGKVTDLYRVRAFPSSYFIDSDGVIRFVHLGTLNEDQLSGYLQKLGVGS